MKQVLIASTAALTLGGAPAQEPPTLVYIPAGTSPRTGPAENFTGSIRIDTSFEGIAPSRVSGARVTFEPGARSNWHSHPLGQTLIVTSGRGLVQEAGGAVREIGAGDVVVTAPGVKHWHGAAPDSAMTHFAVAERADGEVVTWMEPVTNSQYRRRR